MSKEKGDKMKTIEYKGKSITTKHFCNLSDDEFESLRRGFYQRPTIEEVKKELLTISQGGGKDIKYHKVFRQRFDGKNYSLSL